jgi:Spy/CpxP family protein refolding chaperone
MDGSNGSRKAVLLVALVFVLGIALGGIGMYVVTTRVHAERAQTSGHNPANTMAMFTRDLNLTPEQQTEIQAILSDTRARYGVLHDKFDPEYERVRHEGRERIRQTLTAEQRPKFEDLLRRIDEDRRRRQAAQGH